MIRKKPLKQLHYPEIRSFVFFFGNNFQVIITSAVSKLSLVNGSTEWTVSTGGNASKRTKTYYLKRPVTEIPVYSLNRTYGGKCLVGLFLRPSLTKGILWNNCQMRGHGVQIMLCQLKCRAGHLCTRSGPRFSHLQNRDDKECAVHAVVMKETYIKRLYIHKKEEGNSPFPLPQFRSLLGEH